MLQEKEVLIMYATFQTLIKDLEPFINTDGMRLALDKDGQAFLFAPDFSEPLAPESRISFQAFNEAAVKGSVREKMRQALAKHRSIHSDPFAIPEDAPSP